MDEKILVRVYAVGFGDCVYVRIPDGDGSFHMLIDCGTSAPAAILRAVVDDVRAQLPLEGDDRRLDLLVATHPHADHIKGFDPEWFKGIKIRRIWLTIFMKPDHPQAKGMRAFQDLANDAAIGLIDRSVLLGRRGLVKRRGLALAPGVRSLLERSIWNRGALAALREDLAKASGIRTDYPLYVARDLAKRQSAQERDKYQVTFEEGITCFRGFEDRETCLRVLAPEWDIDKWYLGEGSTEVTSPADQQLLQTEAYRGTATDLGQIGPVGIVAAGRLAASAAQPLNISALDFRLLRSRLLYSGLAFSKEDDALKNNTSVVLLLECRGRRLLFAADAEWQGTGVEEGRRNGTWDVMVHIPEVKEALLHPLDLLKVAHHGSHNGTPFLKGGKEQVLQEIASADRTQVVVSTVTGVHGDDMPVPFPELMAALGGMAANKRRYPDTPEVELKDVYQPQRTDLEPRVAGKKARYIEVTVNPV